MFICPLASTDHGREVSSLFLILEPHGVATTNSLQPKPPSLIELGFGFCISARGSCFPPPSFRVQTEGPVCVCVGGGLNPLRTHGLWTWGLTMTAVFVVHPLQACEAVTPGLTTPGTLRGAQRCRRRAGHDRNGVHPEQTVFAAAGQVRRRPMLRGQARAPGHRDQAARNM